MTPVYVCGRTRIQLLSVLLVAFLSSAGVVAS